VDLALAELGARQGIHYPMIDAWKREAIDGTASTFACGLEVARASAEAEIDKLRWLLQGRPAAFWVCRTGHG